MSERDSRMSETGWKGAVSRDRTAEITAGVRSAVGTPGRLKWEEKIKLSIFSY